MKEMLTNLADGQIELYKSVRDTYYLYQAFSHSVAGDGGMGPHYTHDRADTG